MLAENRIRSEATRDEVRVTLTEKERYFAFSLFSNNCFFYSFSFLILFRLFSQGLSLLSYFCLCLFCSIFFISFLIVSSALDFLFSYFSLFFYMHKEEYLHIPMETAVFRTENPRLDSLGPTDLIDRSQLRALNKID